jgi:hypothetical protein
MQSHNDILHSMNSKISYVRAWIRLQKSACGIVCPDSHHPTPVRAVPHLKSWQLDRHNPLGGLFRPARGVCLPLHPAIFFKMPFFCCGYFHLLRGGYKPPVNYLFFRFLPVQRTFFRFTHSHSDMLYWLPEMSVVDDSLDFCFVHMLYTCKNGLACGQLCRHSLTYSRLFHNA